VPPDESIVPRRKEDILRSLRGTPVLRADATDDQDFAEGGEIGTEPFADDPEYQAELACPICGLPECGHNLVKVPRT
jgi:hypothetical protein